MSVKQQKTKTKTKQKAKTQNEYEQMLIDFIKTEFNGVV